MAVAVILVMVVIIIAGVLIIISGGKSKKDQKASQEKLYKKAYSFLSSNFLCSMQMMRIYNSLAALSIYTRAELQMLSTKYFLMSSGIAIVLIVSAVILFKDTVSILIAIAFAVLVNNTMVTKQIDKTNLMVYKALKYTLASVRQEYMKLNSIPEAIAEADIHPLLRKPMEEIHAILTSTNSELKLMKFYESSPFRSLQTFAGICFNINNSGDGKDEFGQSNFIQALTMLTSDVNSEITRLVTLKTKFGIIEYLTFVPIFAMNFIESYFQGIMPGTAMIYNGMLGYLGRTITLIMCIVCYLIITNINSSAPIKEDDRLPFTKTLLMKPDFYNFIWTISPKNAARRKLEAKLKRALSRKSPEHVYTEKVVYSIAGFFIALIATISIVSIGRDFTINSTQQLSLVASSEMDDYTKDEILEMDRAYFADPTASSWQLDQQMAFVKGYMPNLTDLQAQDQISRMNDKKKMMNNAFFHWYYMLICIGISILAWFIPDMTIILRSFLVQTEAEDDFLQLQTLMAILMNTNADTIDALWQLTEHSRIHKDMLMYAYHSYPSNPEKELKRLQSKTPIIDFKRFLGKLQLTISDLSLAEAYGDLKIERDHMIRVREIQMYATIDKKRGLCGPVSLVPIGCLVVFELLVPLGYLGIKEFMSALGSMGSM